MIIFVEDCDGSRDTFIRDLQSQSRDRIETAAAMLRLIEWLDAMSGDTAVFVCLSHLHLVFLTGPSTNSTASATVMWHVRKGAYVIQFPYVGSELMWQDASIEVEEAFVGRVVDVLVDVSAVGKSEEDRTERSVQLAEVLGRYRRLECCLDSYLQSLCGAMLTVL